MRRILLLFALALTLLLLAAPFPASAADPGTVQGKVVNKSVGGDPLPADLKVELIGLYEGAPADPWQATVGPDGTFAFTGMPADGKSFVALTTFLEVTYGSDEINLTADKPTAQVELAVYNTTADGANVGIGRNHVIVDFDSTNKVLTVMDVVVVVNKADRTYVGGEKKNAAGQRETLRLNLPAGATHVQMVDGLDDTQAAVVEGVLVDTMPVAPTGRQIILSYYVPYQEPNGALTRALDYPVEKVSLLIRDVGAQVQGDGMAQLETRDMGGRRYLQLAADNVPAGRAVGVTLSAIPATIASAPAAAPSGAAASPTVPTDRLGLAIAGVGGLLLVLGVAYPVLRRRHRASVGEPAGGAEEWDELVANIATLDDEYDAGQIDESEYQRLRGQMKNRLRRLGRPGSA